MLRELYPISQPFKYKFNSCKLGNFCILSARYLILLSYYPTLVVSKLIFSFFKFTSLVKAFLI